MLAVAASRRVVVRTRVPTLIVTIESAAVRATCRDVESPIDRSCCYLAPARDVVTLRGDAPAARVAVVGFGPQLLEAVVEAHANVGVQRAKLTRWLEQPTPLPRTVWIHEIVHRYVFERVTLGQSDNDATRFLEVEILKEIYFLFRDRESGSDRASIVRTHPKAVERALSYIEAHLFAPVSLPELVTEVATSESSLLRAFRRELSCTPAAFWRRRKLDEALVMLRSGRDSVSEVAQQVGYENSTAFGHAFRQRFGRPPSAFLPKAPVRRAP